MKYFILFILSWSLISASNSQYTRYVIQLRDKGDNTYSLSNPSQFVSARTIARRTRYNIPFDSIDLPVTNRYIDSIKKIGSVSVLSVSKWLNRVLIRTTNPSDITLIEAFPFVVSTKEIAPRAGRKVDKFNEEIKPLPANQNKPQGIDSDTFNYGNNYRQVHIHEGEFLHNKGFTGSNIQITVLDAGFQQYRTNTAFDSVRMNGQILGERDFVTFDNSVNEDDNHGMYCLSTMAANWPGGMVGTAPKANYWLVRTEDARSEYPIEEFNWVVGAEFADSTGSDMISSSLGYNTFDDPAFDHTYAEFYKNIATVSQGAAIAVKKGMIVMNSAGNDGNNPWKYIAFPAESDSVCAVGSVDYNGNLSGFSSRGYPGKVKPNIVSVGSGTVIAGLNNMPSSGSGTSFSNPNVAGLVACLWQAFPSLTNMQLLDVVFKSSNKYSAPDANYGFGIPNFRKAYRLVRHDQNVAVYGNEWLFATPNPFTDKIDVLFIGRTDGNATISLISPEGVLLFQKVFTVEEEEVYNYTFNDLGTLPGGEYIIQYADNSTTKSVTIVKEGALAQTDWLKVTPNPFRSIINIRLKAPDEGSIGFRLVDAKGAIVSSLSATVTVNQIRNFQLSTNKLAAGVYYLQYISNKQKRVVRLVKY